MLLIAAKTNVSDNGYKTKRIRKQIINVKIAPDQKEGKDSILQTEEKMA